VQSLSKTAGEALIPAARRLQKATRVKRIVRVTFIYKLLRVVSFRYEMFEPKITYHAWEPEELICKITSLFSDHLSFHCLIHILSRTAELY
jgi:hypothetical protein